MIYDFPKLIEELRIAGEPQEQEQRLKDYLGACEIPEKHEYSSDDLKRLQSYQELIINHNRQEVFRQKRAENIPIDEIFEQLKPKGRNKKTWTLVELREALGLDLGTLEKAIAGAGMKLKDKYALEEKEKIAFIAINSQPETQVPLPSELLEEFQTLGAEGAEPLVQSYGIFLSQMTAAIQQHAGIGLIERLRQMKQQGRLAQMIESAVRQPHALPMATTPLPLAIGGSLTSLEEPNDGATVEAQAAQG